MERVCVFIDGSNLYHSLKNECGQKNLDFAKFVDSLVAARQLVRTYYYNAPVDASRDKEKAKAQQSFFANLMRVSYFEIRLGRLEPRGNTFVEKGVDVSLAVDMVSMAYKGIYDTAILVSCDGDYVTAVNAVRDTGRHIEVACFRRAYSLMKVADKVIPLNAESLKGLWLQD